MGRKRNGDETMELKQKQQFSGWLRARGNSSKKGQAAAQPGGDDLKIRNGAERR